MELKWLKEEQKPKVAVSSSIYTAMKYRIEWWIYFSGEAFLSGTFTFFVRLNKSFNPVNSFLKTIPTPCV
jgi:hypothetical protein